MQWRHRVKAEASNSRVSIDRHLIHIASFSSILVRGILHLQLLLLATQRTDFEWVKVVDGKNRKRSDITRKPLKAINRDERIYDIPYVYDDVIPPVRH